MKCYLCGNPIEDSEVCCTLTLGNAPDADMQMHFRPQRLLGLVCQSCAEPQQPDSDYVQEIAEIVATATKVDQPDEEQHLSFCTKCGRGKWIPLDYSGHIVCSKCGWGYISDPPIKS